MRLSAERSFGRVFVASFNDTIGAIANRVTICSMKHVSLLCEACQR